MPRRAPDGALPQQCRVEVVLPSGEHRPARYEPELSGLQAWVFDRADQPTFHRFAGSDLDQYGVYVLAGGGARPPVYVGKGILISRLRDHRRERERWTYGITFSRRDRALTDAHIRWAEATLIDRARAAGWVELLNARGERAPDLAESDLSLASAFLGDACVVLGMIGLPISESRRIVEAPGSGESDAAAVPYALSMVRTWYSASEIAEREAVVLARMREKVDWVVVPELTHELGWRVELGHSRGRITARGICQGLAERGLLEITTQGTGPYKVRTR